MRCFKKTLLLGLVLMALTFAPTLRAAPAIQGLDHIVLAVEDLEAASTRYEELGFTLKPGRPHDNGIRNRHVKFPDGTEIELLHVSEARDALTSFYAKHLAQGDGPAFVGFFAPEPAAVVRLFEDEGRDYRRGGGLLSFPAGAPLHYVFFGGRNESPTDRAETFAHANGADALIGVWLSADDLSAERELLTSLGAQLRPAEPRMKRARGEVLELPQAEVRLLNGSRQEVAGRRIVGAVVRTRSLEWARRAIEKSGLKLPPVVRNPRGNSLFLAPSLTHGIWLELREDPGRRVDEVE